MAKIAQLVEGNYNILDNIPVINQDLSATDFTPVANTYYRHTGATTDTFTQGVIYLYDTAYHKLGESGGGTKLNRYKTSIQLKSSTAGLVYRIYNNCKGNIISMWNATDYGNGYIILTSMSVSSNSYSMISFSVTKTNYNNGNSFKAKLDTNSFEITNYNPTNIGIDIIYYNDTEIT